MIEIYDPSYPIYAPPLTCRWQCHMLARRQGRSLQLLMAEAFNDALHKYGEGPIRN